MTRRRVLFAIFANMILYVNYFTPLLASSVLECLNNDLAYSPNIIERLGALIALDRNTNSYRSITFYNGNILMNDDLALPVIYNGHSIIGRPLISQDGTSLLAVYGDHSLIDTVTIVNISDGTEQKWDLNLTYSSNEPPSISWLNDNEISISFYDISLETPIFLLIDTRTSIILAHQYEFLSSQAHPLDSPHVSPDLNNIVYMSIDTQGIIHLSIYNTEEQTVLPLLSVYNMNSVRYFELSPDGDNIAVAENPNFSNQPQTLIIFDNAGNRVIETPLTYPLDYPVYANSFAWSPSGTRLLFKNGNRLAYSNILDLNNNLIINTCLTGESLWSLDSNFITTFIREEATEVAPSVITQILVYDLSTRTTYALSNLNLNMGPLIGWAEIDQ